MPIPHYVRVYEGVGFVRFRVEVDKNQEAIIDVYPHTKVVLNVGVELDVEGTTRVIEALLLARTTMLLGESD